MQSTYEKISMKSGPGLYFNITDLTDDPYIKRLNKGCDREHYDILWVCNGTGTYAVNHSSYPITPNSLYCGAPGQYHQILSAQRVEGIMISFNHDFIYQGYDQDASAFSAHLLSEFMNFITVQLTDSMASEMNTLVQKMRSELVNGEQMKMEVLKFYLRILLIHIRRTMKITTEQTTGHSSMVKRFLTQIEMDFFKKKSVGEYASMLCVSANYLNQIVKQQTGGTAGYYIRRRIIAEAKRKALHSSQSMKQIAFSLGFDSEAHFSKFFKNYTGMSFSEFKRNGSQSLNEPASYTMAAAG